MNLLGLLLVARHTTAFKSAIASSLPMRVSSLGGYSAIGLCGPQPAGPSEGEKKVFLNGSFAKRPRVAHMFDPWLVAIGGWRLVAIGGWRLVAIGGWRLVAIGGWWLVAIGGWRLVAIGGWWLVAIGGWRLVGPDPMQAETSLSPLRITPTSPMKAKAVPVDNFTRQPPALA